MESVMLKEAFDFLAQKGLLSPVILAAAMVAVVYFQSGVDTEQRDTLEDLKAQDRIITSQIQQTSENLKITAALLNRIDEQGTKHELAARERDLSRREPAGK
jgi:hypothetical protein